MYVMIIDDDCVLLLDDGWEPTDEVLPRAKAASLAAYIC
jgi:hypothetical protein